MEAVARTKNPQIHNNVVMMLPSSIRCTACRNVMAKGTKFNSRKEEATGEEFCPWKDSKFRYYFNCTQCSAEIVILIRTNQRYSGLVVEAGASNYYGHETPWFGLPCVVEKEPLVPYRDPNWQEKRYKLFGASLFNMKKQIKEKKNQKGKIEEVRGAMKSLDLNREMDIPAAVDEIKSVKECDFE